MLVVTLVAESAGPRMAACMTSRGPLARTLATRWQCRLGCCRTLYSQAGGTQQAVAPRATRVWPCWQRRGFLDHVSLRGKSRRYSTWEDVAPTESTLSPDDIRFLGVLAQKHGRQIPVSNSHNIDSRLGIPPVNNTASSSRSEVINSVATSEDGLERLHNQFHSALHAMQRRDSRRLLAALTKITDLPQDDLADVVSTLPRTTFSEFLRSLDPLQIGRDNDPTHGKAIGPGMWQILNLGNVLDEWGIRTIYTKLLRQMLVLVRALKATGHVLNVNDYVPLIRAAGITSDSTVAKLLWDQMKTDGVDYWRNYITYHEFVKARFLIDPAYSGYDAKRFMMTPRNLHRRGRIRFTASLRRLDRLQYHLRQRAFKFGLERHTRHVLDITRLLRKPLPPTRVFAYTQRHGMRMTDDLMCTFMVAFARAGSLRFIQHRILEDYFGISVSSDKGNGQPTVRRFSGRRNITGTGDLFRPGRPFLRPNAKLIEAAVYTYCSNARLPMALTIAEFISSTFHIPLSQRVWCNLLEWAYVLSTPPTSTAWKMAGWHHQVPSPDAIDIIWNTMTAPPHNVQPGFKQYNILIQNKLNLGDVDEAIAYMRQARRFYDAQCTEYETAAFNYAAAKFVNVNCTKEIRAFQRARFLRSFMKQQMRSWCTILLEKSVRPSELHDLMATQGVPGLVSEWRDIMMNPVRYQTATGYVSLLDPAEPVEKTVFVRDHVLEIPVRRLGQWHLRPVIQRQYRLLSKHGLGDLLSTRLHPLAILKGIVPRGRPSRSRRVEKYRAWRAAQEQPAASTEGQNRLPEVQAGKQSQSDEDIWDDDD